MSLFTRDVESRDMTWQDVWGSDSAPMMMGEYSVTRVGPVYAAVSMIADLFVQAKIQAGAEAADGELIPVPAPAWLRDPDPYVTRSTWRYQMVVSLKLRGNAYGLTDPDRRYVRWLHPEWVSIDESNPLRPRYWVLGQEVQLVKQGGSLIHVAEFVHPGRVRGLSPIGQFMDLFEAAKAAADYGRRWFKNSSVPPAILSTKFERIGADRLREARDDFIAAAKDGKPVALPGEWSWQKVTLDPKEAQFLETIKATATQIAAIFRVAPEDIGGESGSSRTYSNREMDSGLLNTRTMQPIGVRMSDAFEPMLPTGQSLRVGFDALAQPGLLESARVDTEELTNGTLTLAEARRRKGRSPLTAEDVTAWQDHYATKKTVTDKIADAIGMELP